LKCIPQDLEYILRLIQNELIVSMKL